ncbi:MAG TPA: tyrosine-type recombinase/integrase [Methylocella sp.]|nr:tyrosine-type recombinase/integrase [Methylocella sp.]
MPRLAKRLVETIAVATAPVYAWDDQLAGFGVKVLPSGRRKYVCKYRVGGGREGRDRWYLIGTHGQLTCDQAREMAMQILSAVARGQDPQSDRMAAREAPTLSDLWNRYSTEHLPRKKPSSSIDDNQKARDYILPRLGRRKVTEITRADIYDLHRELANRPYQANRVLALLSKMLNLAEAWGYRPDGSNPCRHIEKYKEQARQRYLSNDELRRLGVVLDELEATSAHGVYAAAAIKLLLLTGARVNEVLQARWDWVDWDRNSIVLRDSKTGPKSLFLSNPALVVLRNLSARPEAATSEFIIKGRLPGKPLVNLAKPWKGLCRAAELDGVRIHDLRHTAASVGVGHGLSLPIIGRLLGHSQPQTTNRYAHVDGDPALLAINMIGETIGTALGIPSDSNVVRSPGDER